MSTSDSGTPKLQIALVLQARQKMLKTTVGFILCMLSGSNLPCSFAQDYSPDHPKVKDMVDKAVNYLANLPDGNSSSWDGGTGLLTAYTLYKTTGEKDHPKVKAGISSAQRLAHDLASQRQHGEKIVYVSSVAAVLLADVDPVAYRPELDLILDWFLSVQKRHGGYGYMNNPNGDTSQVQYAMLAMWAMHIVGLEVPFDSVENTLRYLKSTIDPSGGWGYQGRISNGVPIQQDQVTKSLATAGAGGVLIAGDILGFFRSARGNDKTEGIPDAFVRIDLLAKRRAERKPLTMSRSDLEPLVDAATRYHNNNGFSGGFFYYYWRYSQERYESFREIMDGKQNKSPTWYVQGVNDLASLQEADGRWAQAKKSDYTSDDICTCFAVLFLIRSTQKTIGKLDEGVTFGGYGLPTDVSTIKMVGGRIVSDAESSMENLLAMLEKNEASDIEIGLLPDNLQLTQDPTQRKEQVARLSRLLVSGDYAARRVAAKLLGRSEDLNQVPDLIYALTDEDPYVPMIAEEGLRLLSRKLKAVKLGVAAEYSAKQAAERFWKDWYLGLRPDYIFISR